MPPKPLGKTAPAAGKKGEASDGVNNSEKKNSGPNLMPSKRPDPMKEERAGQQRPPSRVMTSTPAAPPVPLPLVRSKLLTDRTQVSRLAYGLTVDKARGETTSIDKLPPAPEMDTQWMALRRLQGRYIAGPHGELLKADGIGSGVTEPFFFSAVRPGSSANKRASPWFGSTVTPLLGPRSIEDKKQQQQLPPRAASTAPTASGGTMGQQAAAAAAQQTSARMMDPNATSAPKTPRKRKNPNPTNLKEWVAFTFGGPQQILQGTPAIIKEFHAQCFPLVRADGSVEILQVAQRVFAAMAPPTMHDVVEVTAAWMERVAEKDREAAEEAAASAAALADAEYATVMAGDGSDVGSVSAAGGGPNSPSQSVSRTAGAGGGGGGGLTPRGLHAKVAEEPPKSTVPPPVGAPPGYIAYAILLHNVEQILLDQSLVDEAYDLCDVCCDGVVNKEAVKRAVAALMSQNNNNNNNQQQQLQTSLLSSVSPLDQQHGQNFQQSQQSHFFSNSAGGGDSTTVPSGSQSMVGGATTTVVSGVAAAHQHQHQNHHQQPHNQQQSFLHRGGSPAPTTTSNHSRSLAAGGGGGGNAVFRSLRQLHSDLQEEHSEYKRSRAQHQLTTDEFVDSVIRSTLLGPNSPVRERAPPPGRFWVTARPKQPPPLLPSVHFHFPVAAALMRAFKHISGFEEFRCLHAKGKSKRKGATLPSMRQEHITRAEFGDMFVSDPHVATPFLPFMLRRAVARLPASELGPDLQQHQQQQHGNSESSSARSPQRSLAHLRGAAGGSVASFSTGAGGGLGAQSRLSLNSKGGDE